MSEQYTYEAPQSDQIKAAKYKAELEELKKKLNILEQREQDKAANRAQADRARERLEFLKNNCPDCGTLLHNGPCDPQYKSDYQEMLAYQKEQAKGPLPIAPKELKPSQVAALEREEKKRTIKQPDAPKCMTAGCDKKAKWKGVCGSCHHYLNEKIQEEFGFTWEGFHTMGLVDYSKEKPIIKAFEEALKKRNEEYGL